MRKLRMVVGWNDGNAGGAGANAAAVQREAKQFNSGSAIGT
jgi:F0F1-type ATP synthase membrane subunit c/vacuolar-type H+-ATPase subunit K